MSRKQKPKLPPWIGFAYQPVAYVADKIAARAARRERASFLKFLNRAATVATPLGRTCMDLAHELRQLHDDPKLGRVTKRERFARILEKYAAARTAGVKPTELGQVALND